MVQHLRHTQNGLAKRANNFCLNMEQSEPMATWCFLHITAAIVLSTAWFLIGWYFFLALALLAQFAKRANCSIKMFDFGQTRSFNVISAYLVFEPLLRGPAIKRSPINFPKFASHIYCKFDLYSTCTVIKRMRSPLGFPKWLMLSV